MIGLPAELRLNSTGDGPRLSASPIKRIESLRSQNVTPLKVNDRVLKAGGAPFRLIPTELFEIDAEVAPSENAEVRIAIHGALITYNAAKKEISFLGKKASLPPIDGKIRLRIFVDRASIDIFGNNGALYMPMGFIPKERDRGGLSHDDESTIENMLRRQAELGSISSHNGDATIINLRQWALTSAWKK